MVSCGVIMPTQGLIPSLPADASPSDRRKYPIPALVIFWAQNSAICGFLAGVPLAVTAIKTYDLMMKPKGPKSKIIKLVEEE